MIASLSPAVIFDWDGVLVDSSRQHEASWELLAAEGGRALPAGHFKRGFGMKNEAIIADLLGWTRDPREMERLSLRKEELFRELVARQGICVLPGAREFVARLRAQGVPRAIASSTHRLNITTCLRLLHLESDFDALVAAEDVDRGKPDPQVFLRAAEALHTPPECCVVFEDAPAGLAAAKRAGMHAVGVAGTHPAGELAAADRVVPNLQSVTAADVRNWART